MSDSDQMDHSKRLNPLSGFNIDPSEEFPTLKSAPSIEAVIHWQAHASKALEPEALKEQLTQRLPDYPIYQTQQDIEIGAGETPDGVAEIFHRTQWNGFRLKDEQERHVAQFTPSGVVFSRLEPYEKWESFKSEAMRFWEIFLELAAPVAIQRLGVRYINRIPLDSGEQISFYLRTVPSAPPGLALPIESFFYQDTYRVPGYPYQINWLRTIQPTGADPVDGQALIVDIDVFTTESFQLNKDTLNQRLQEMRWLKNKVFFSCITDTALKQFGA